MNKRKVTTTIDPKICTGCRLCIKVCPSDTLSIKNNIAVVTGDKSLSCGHCQAVCPEGAVKVHAMDENATRFETFSLDTRWLGFGEFEPARLARLITSRRSCRNFSKKPVEKAMLRDLIKLACFAPSGTNSQKWTFTCLTTRGKVLRFGDLVLDFFKKINKKAESKLLRTLLTLLGNRQLDTYYEEYYESVKEAINDFKHHDIDRLFHGATACILIGSLPGASCPKEDAILACGNILLFAHTMGLGTCVIGFAQKAVEKDPSIAAKLGIPGHEKIHAVIALGFPDEKYQTITGRKKPVTRFF